MAAIEIARFRVKDGAEEQMLAERPAMVDAMRRRFPTYRESFLTKLDDGRWMDVVVWEDRAEAEAAAEGAYAYPEIVEWFRHLEDGGFEFEYADIRCATRIA
ncbi:MAG: antibiotic biosynthesis monooxygenase [Thermoleophilaceae bacterium]